MISVIIPALNEADSIVTTLKRLQGPRMRGHEVLLVDGGSQDDTIARARPFVDRILRGERGRAAQMNLGASVARGDVLWFVHADTLVPEDADGAIQRALDAGADWGWFRVRIAGRSPLLPVIAWFMNRRSCLTRIATGDQGLFLRRVAWDGVGGFPAVPLMEDVAITSRLRRRFPGGCLAAKVATSGRRWEQRGVLRTVFLMWRLRLAYFLGADPAVLARRYR
ncbi:MAG: TIGR04283 family arsenosugar biosynthesis glycosyltransferase [Ectothiorhodospiraceae bacterium]|nr:TIGR04283 family arsenosugar biosynthesis glycosyltransferase [Ectothiorhodospiraceae bacterium]